VTSVSQGSDPPEPGPGSAADRTAPKAPDRRRESEEPGRRHALVQTRHRLAEDTELAELLTDWVQQTWPQDQVKRTFIGSEVEGRLRSYRTWARFWRILQISTWLLIAILGLLITVLAGLKTGRGFTIVAGALVATLTTLTNAMHPSKQADAYLTARLALRDEGWDLVTGTGAYAPTAAPDDAARFDQFKTKVRQIVSTKRTSTNLDSLAPG
jgi:hypothetical protein